MFWDWFDNDCPFGLRICLQLLYGCQGGHYLACVLLLSSEWDEGEGEAHFRVEFVASDSYETNVTTMPMDTPAQNEECLLRWVNWAA